MVYMAIGVDDRALEGCAVRWGRLDVADAAAASGEEDEVLGKDGGAVASATPLADSLPGADDAALEILGAGHTGRRQTSVGMVACGVR